MNSAITNYNNNQTSEDKVICDFLAHTFCKQFPEAENKIWHAHPVWFLDGNPVVGYNKLKDGVRVLFWRCNSYYFPMELFLNVETSITSSLSISKEISTTSPTYSCYG